MNPSLWSVDISIKASGNFKNHYLFVGVGFGVQFSQDNVLIIGGCFEMLPHPINVKKKIDRLCCMFMKLREKDAYEKNTTVGYYLHLC